MTTTSELNLFSVLCKVLCRYSVHIFYSGMFAFGCQLWAIIFTQEHGRIGPIWCPYQWLCCTLKDPKIIQFSLSPLCGQCMYTAPTVGWITEQEGKNTEGVWGSVGPWTCGLDAPPAPVPQSMLSGGHHRPRHTNETRRRCRACYQKITV